MAISFNCRAMRSCSAGKAWRILVSVEQICNGSFDHIAKGFPGLFFLIFEFTL